MHSLMGLVAFCRELAVLSFSADRRGKSMPRPRAEELIPCSKAGKNQKTFLKKIVLAKIIYMYIYTFLNNCNEEVS